MQLRRLSFGKKFRHRNLTSLHHGNISEMCWFDGAWPNMQQLRVFHPSEPCSRRKAQHKPCSLSRHVKWHTRQFMTRETGKCQTAARRGIPSHTIQSGGCAGAAHCWRGPLRTDESFARHFHSHLSQFYCRHCCVEQLDAGGRAATHLEVCENGCIRSFSS